MTEDLVHAYAEQLRQYATHFSPRDWNYTRNHVVKVMYYNTFPERVKDAIHWQWRYLLKKVRREKSGLDKVLKVGWWRMTQAHWRFHNHLPDGVLDGGNVITHWEETGEYLQYVQPSVGALLADLMDAHPDLPEVQAVAAEMKRINDNYGLRLAQEEDDA